MTESQRLFLVQAQSNYRVFGRLRQDETLPHSHALHYLQMATELLGKAYAWRKGPPKKLTHRAFVTFLRELSANPKAKTQLGFSGQNEAWEHLLRKCIPTAERIEDLAPTLAGDAPNPEYPWPPNEPAETPVEFDFPLWGELTETVPGRRFIQFLTDLFAIAEAYL